MAETLRSSVQVAWTPNAGKQTAAICCPIRDLFYGGARGGGKSAFLLGDFAVRAQRWKGDFHGVLFRRTYPELEDLKKKAFDLYPRLGAQWQEGPHTWRFPSSSTLKMRYLERDDHATRYQGHEYQWVGVDEAGTFPSPAPIDFLWGCMRSTKGVPCVRRLTGNPGGAGHEWLKSRYVTPSRPMIPFVGEEDGIQRVFIPAYLRDTPQITDPEAFKQGLRAAGPAWLVKAWLEGDWSGQPVGGMLDPKRIVLLDEDPLWLRRKMGLQPVCYWDFAVTEKELESDDPDYSACVVVAREDSRMYILDAWREQCAPEVTARQIIAMQRKWNARVKAEKGAIEKCMQAPLQMLAREIGHPIHMEPIGKGRLDKVSHSIAYQMLLGSGSVYAPARARWLKDLLHEHATFPTQGRGIHDDWIDCLSFAAQDLNNQPSAKPDPFNGRKFHPEITHAVLERFEQLKRDAEEPEGEFEI